LTIHRDEGLAVERVPVSVPSQSQSQSQRVRETKQSGVLDGRADGDTGPIMPRLLPEFMVKPKTAPEHSASPAMLKYIPANLMTEQVEMTPRSFVEGRRVLKYLAPLNIHMIKEDFSIGKGSGVGFFSHRFVRDVHNVACAHAKSVGANAILSYCLTESQVDAEGDTAYAIFSLSGDAVLLE
jgi:hypothetical protein